MGAGEIVLMTRLGRGKLSCSIGKEEKNDLGRKMGRLDLRKRDTMYKGPVAGLESRGRGHIRQGSVEF